MNRGVLLAAILLACASSLRIEASAVSAVPRPMVPDGTGVGMHPTLAWASVEGVADYEVEWSREAAFTGTAQRDRIEVPRWVPLEPWPAGMNFWRVRARGPAGDVGPWSDVARYEVRVPRNVFEVPAGAGLEQIRQILARAAAATPARVEFARGAVHRLHPRDHAFELREVSDLVINGNGAQFVITQPSAGFMRLERCARVTVRNLSIDYDPLPHSVGKVMGVERDSGSVAVVVRPEEGYPPFDAPHMLANWSWGVVLDADPARRGWMKAEAPLVAGFDGRQVRRMAEGEGADFRVPLTNSAQGGHIAPGDRIIVFARRNGRELIGHAGCEDITYAGLTIYACPAGHFNYQNGSGLKVLGCREEIRPGRWFAGNADGVHARGNAVGPWVEGCRFDGLGDDAIALYNKGIRIGAVLARDRLRVGPEHFDLQRGHRFRIFDPRAGRVVADDRLVQEVQSEGPEKVVTFAPALESGVELVIGESRSDQNDQLFNLSLRNDGFVVRRNEFRAIRRYGTVFRSSDGLVADNRYEGISNAAIALLNEPVMWRNGLGGDNVFITRNEFGRAAFDGSARGVGQVEVALHGTAGLSRERIYRGVRIIENRFDAWGDRAISLQNAVKAVVAGNRFGAPAIASTQLAPVHLRLVTESDIYENIGVDASGIEMVESSSVRVRDNLAR